MKVLHFYKTSLPQSHGGVETFIDTLCVNTATLGVENTVLSLAANPADGPIDADGYRIVQVKRDLFLASTGFSISAFSAFGKSVRESDVVHYHFPNPFADVLHFALRVKKPTLITYHSDIVKQKYLREAYKPLMNLFLKSTDRIVATSASYAASSPVLRKYSDKLAIIPAGIDKNEYPRVDAKKTAYWRKRIPGRFFLFIGALRYYKGLHIALDAVKGTDIRLVLAGGGGIEKELKARVRRERLHNVDFLGFVSDEDKVALLRSCYGFVFPSHLRSEAFGISLLEASMYGKPMISCKIGTGTDFVNAHKETGLAIEPSSPEALRGAMRYLLRHPSTAAEFGKNAEKRYNRLFTAKKQARSYYRLYRELG